MTAPEVISPKGRRLPSSHAALLQHMFAERSRLVVSGEFTEGQSPTTVYLVRPYDRRGRPELPFVVKMGSSDLIRQAQDAEQQHLQGKLPGFIAADPMAELPGMGEDGAELAGLRYRMAGNGVFPVQTLRDYLQTATSSTLWHTLEGRLFVQLNELWQADLDCHSLSVRAVYDRVLPVSLTVNAFSDDELSGLGESTMHLPQIEAEQLCDERFMAALNVGSPVCLAHMVVGEVDLLEQSVTLAFPEHLARDSMICRIRVFNLAGHEQLRVGDAVADIQGRVLETRTTQLFNLAQSALGAGVDLHADRLPLPSDADVSLPNPLQAWPALLDEFSAQQVSTIHGDLNMGNVLVDVKFGVTYVIDGAHARTDAVLYDLLRLEMDAVLHHLPALFFEHNLPPEAIHGIYCGLHCAAVKKAHAPGQFAIPQSLDPALEPLFVSLITLRKIAGDYLATPNDWRQYYALLALYLLGSTKFSSLNEHPPGQKPVAVAFWGAATALWLREGHGPRAEIAWRFKDLAHPRQVGGHLSLPLAALDGWLNDLSRETEYRFGSQQVDNQPYWPSMVLRGLGVLAARVTPPGLLKALMALVLWAVTAWLLGPILHWPLGDERERLMAVLQFALAAWGVPVLLALAAQQRLPSVYAPKTKWDKLAFYFLKLIGALVGFVAISGAIIALAILWRHLSGATLGTMAARFFVLAPLVFGYAAALQLPIDRCKMSAKAAPNGDDWFFLAVFALAGPAMAAFLYWSHDFLIDGAAGLAVVLSLMALLLWEMRQRDPAFLSDSALILILGLALPLAVMLLATFSTVSPLSQAGWRDLADLLVVLACVLSATLLLATLWVRNRPTLTLRSVFGLLGAAVSTLLLLDLHPWVGGLWGVLLLGGWFLWGRERYRRYLRFHPGFWCMPALIGGVIGLAAVGMAAWVIVGIYLFVMALLIAWAYHPEGSVDSTG